MWRVESVDRVEFGELRVEFRNLRYTVPIKTDRYIVVFSGNVPENRTKKERRNPENKTVAKETYLW